EYRQRRAGARVVHQRSVPGSSQRCPVRGGLVPHEIGERNRAPRNDGLGWVKRHADQSTVFIGVEQATGIVGKTRVTKEQQLPIFSIKWTPVNAPRNSV